MSAVGDTTARPQRRQREVVVQMNTRIALTTRTLIDDIAYREGLSIREVIERAIEATWGSSGAGDSAPPAIQLPIFDRGAAQ